MLRHLEVILGYFGTILGHLKAILGHLELHLGVGGAGGIGFGDQNGSVWA